MLRRVLLIVLLALLAAGDLSASPAYAQFFGGGNQQSQSGQPHRRGLFDFLFGGGDDDQQQPAPPPPVVKPRKATLPVPPKPEIAKAATATRLAVFGDTLAVDLAAALDRYYADDPNIIIINQGVGSSGFARPDYFDWDKTAADQVKANSFDLAVMIVGINDRQTINDGGKSEKALTPDWTTTYEARVSQFVTALESAKKPLVWVGLPPVAKPDLSSALGQISAVQRLAVFSGGAQFVDIYDKFVDDNGDYTDSGPDLNGNQVQMRKADGLRFTAAGADKLAFYVSQSIKLFYHGSGGVGLTIADALAGTDAAIMVRPPYQGLGQTRLLEVAGAVIPLGQSAKPALDLVSTANAPTGAGFDVQQMLDAPQGRADAFGVGQAPATPAADSPTPVSTPTAATVAPAAASSVPPPATTSVAQSN
ncbi:MAG TPA: DUF459 domain-containing protein [Devosia sp.]|nr:DUF459 domain-containing protein [Devosia sp.]